MDRRSLLDDDDTPPTRENMDVFGDEFEVEDFDGIADGFRPGQSHDREGRQDGGVEEDQPTRTVSAQYASGNVSSGPSRNSTRKSRSHQNPFVSPEDEEEAPLRRTPSGNFATVRRSVSSTSSRNFAGQGTPHFGAAGPSHPYGMYPQGTVARTPSAATSSTARPSRQSTSRYAPGPQHPYSLYPQGVGDDLDDDTEETAQNLVPVGFMGLGQAFQRRRGPDGEEQDIIGDYGHAEQLPPYTRYPEDGPEKAPLLDVPSPPGALHSRAPVLGTDPGMSLMHEPLRPAQQSMTDESNLQRSNSRYSRLSGDPESPNDAGDSAQHSLLSKKSWGEKSWSEKRRTKFCGVPLWFVIFLIGVVVFAGAIVGGAVGGFAAGQKSGQKSALNKAASSTLYDASLITTATGVPPATGTFPLSLGLPQETEAACLTNPNDRSAWSCDIVGSDQIWISIESAPAGTSNQNATGAYLYTQPGNDPSSQLSYGSQVTNMVTSFAPFMYVSDLDDPEDGHAFYFQQDYNKLVVVHSDLIDVTSRKLKRDAYGNLPGWLVQKQYATPGDKPWFCYWNNTLMEAFIYKSQPAVIAPSPTSSSATSTITPPPNASNASTSSTNTVPWTITWANPWDTVTTTISMPTTSCTYEGVASKFPNWMHEKYPDFSHYVQGGPGDGPPSKRTVSDPYKKRDSNDDDDDDDDSDSDVFEYLVKIEERRQPQSPAPMCVQYQVLDNYEWNVITNEAGEQVTITLDESDPPGSAYQSAGTESGKRFRRKRTVPGGCHCQWMSGE